MVEEGVVDEGLGWDLGCLHCGVERHPVDRTYSVQTKGKQTSSPAHVLYPTMMNISYKVEEEGVDRKVSTPLLWAPLFPLSPESDL